MPLTRYLATAALTATFVNMAQAQEAAPLQLEITEPYSTTLHCVKQTLSETFGIEPEALNERRGHDRSKSETSLDPDATIVSTGGELSNGKTDVVLSDTGTLVGIYYKGIVGARVDEQARIPWQTFPATSKDRKDFLDFDKRLKNCELVVG